MRKICYLFLYINKCPSAEAEGLNSNRTVAKVAWQVAIVPFIHVASHPTAAEELPIPERCHDRSGIGSHLIVGVVAKLPYETSLFTMGKRPFAELPSPIAVREE